MIIEVKFEENDKEIKTPFEEMQFVNIGKDGETPYIKDGYWWIGDTNTNVKAEGTDGKDGANGLDGKDGENGKDGKDGADGKDGKDGESGVYVGSDTPDTDANVWIDPNGSPTGTAEEWTFTLEDGSTVKKTIAVLG